MAQEVVEDIVQYMVWHALRLSQRLLARENRLMK